MLLSIVVMIWFTGVCFIASDVKQGKNDILLTPRLIKLLVVTLFMAQLLKDFLQ